MADPKLLYREIVELERQLRELLRANPLNAQDANALRARLIAKAEALAAASAPFAAAKEIEQVLWKPCFYRRIEDFRRRVRKYAAASAGGDRATGVREHFARVSSEFQHFLTSAAAFYDRLRALYAAWLDSPNASNAADAAAKCRQSLHRCFVFLGDLARYRELHSQKAKKNFAAAEGFYHQALALAPDNGNPHNQLAVLATYVEAETVAVYRYCRSLLIAQPFATAEENLALLFERARQRPLAGPSLLALTSASPPKDKAASLKSFLHRLARMHGILFSIASSNTTRNTYPREMEGILFKDLDALLRAGAIGDALLLKVVVTNVFCVVRALRGDARTKEDAFRLSARTITSVMEFLIAVLSAKKQPAAAAGGENPNSLRLFGPVSVFCDFLRLNPTVVDLLDEELLGNDDGDDNAGGYQKSHRAFLETFVRLVNHAALKELYSPLVNLRNDQQEQLRAQQLALKENVELRGFSPLAALWEKPQTAGASPSTMPLSPGRASSTTSLPEAAAAPIRAWNLYNFGRFLCEEYEGNPLLYLYQGVFSTTPTVGGGGNGVSISNSFLQAVTAGGSNKEKKNLSVGPMPSPRLFGMMGSTGASSEQQHVATNGNNAAVRPPSTKQTDADDDVDDEVIVFQPSPALAPISYDAVSSSGALGGDASVSSWMTSSPFADLSAGGSFNLGAPSSQSTPEPKRNSSFSDAFSGGFGSGSTLGYPSFHSFSSDFGGFSGQGLLSSGWGNSELSLTAATAAAAVSSTNGLGRPPSVPKPNTGVFGGLSNTQSFAPMLDLAAVERESALYQQEESSLSAFFGSSSSSTTPRSSSASSLNLNLSDASSTRTPLLRSPPPGFSAASLGVAPGGIMQARLSESGTQLRTRNPFVNP